MQLRSSHTKIFDQQPAVISGGWQIIYTGFILILLSFFILLTSFTSLQESKITRFARSFSTEVSVFKRGNSVFEDDAQLNGQLSIVDREDRVAELFEQIRKIGTAHNLEGVDLKISDRGVIMTLSETLLFSSGDARLSANALPLLKKIGTIIHQIGKPVEIEGHTDNRPIENRRYPSNWYLSTARAVNVLRFIIQSVKLEPRHISAAGRSEFHPLYPNTSEANMAANRRVEFIFGID